MMLSCYVSPHCAGFFTVGPQPEIFKGREGCLEYEHFNKCFMYEMQKEDLTGIGFGAFISKILLKRHFK